MTPPVIAVSPTSLNIAGTQVITVGSTLHGELTALSRQLAGCGGMCGNDPSGIVLADAVDNATKALVDSLVTTVNGISGIGDGIRASAANHGNADHASNVAPRGQPRPFPTATPQITCGLPPSAHGGEDEGAFSAIVNVLMSLVGMVCPNGHQDKLRAAASAWRATAAACDTASAGMKNPSSVVDTQRIPESADIDNSFLITTRALGQVAGTCAGLAGQLEQYATRLDQVHHALADLASRLANPGNLISGALDFVTGHDDNSGVVADATTVVKNFAEESKDLGTLFEPLIAAAEQACESMARYVGMTLYNAAADLTNVAASFGNAIAHDPLRMGTDVAVTAAGAALDIVSGGGEVLGAGLDVTGVGAALGVPLNVVSAGGLLAGTGLAAGGLTDMAHEVNGNFVSAMAKKGGGRGPQYHPAPPKGSANQLPAFPDAVRAPEKTTVQGGGKLRARWIDPDGNIYEWDYQHGTVEKYDRRGKHLGEYDPSTGAITKAAVPGRKTVK